MAKPLLSHLEAVLNSGKAITSADDDAIVALVKETIDSGRKATFFLSSAQSNAVRSWFFTPEPISTPEMQPVSAEEGCFHTRQLHHAQRKPSARSRASAAPGERQQTTDFCHSRRAD
jgi:hypothetical protein